MAYTMYLRVYTNIGWTDSQFKSMNKLIVFYIFLDVLLFSQISNNLFLFRCVSGMENIFTTWIEKQKDTLR